MPNISPSIVPRSCAKPDDSVRRVGNWRAMVLTGMLARVEGRVTEWTSEGLAFHCDRPFPQGTRLRLVVALNDLADPSRVRPLTVPLRVTFHVVRGSVFRMNCSFDVLDAETRFTIDTLLAQRTPSNT